MVTRGLSILTVNPSNWSNSRKFFSSFKLWGWGGKLSFKETLAAPQNANNLHLTELRLEQLAVQVPHWFTRGCGLGYFYLAVKFWSLLLCSKPMWPDTGELMEDKIRFDCFKEQNFSTSKEQLPAVLAAWRSESAHSIQPESSSIWYSPIAGQSPSLSFVANFDF